MQKNERTLTGSLIVCEGIFEGVTLVLRVCLFADLLPVAIVREEGVCMRWCVIDFRKTQAVGHLDGLLIDAGATNDIDVLVRLATLQCRL